MTTKRKLGKCQVENCSNSAEFGIFRTLNDKKEWLYVCRLHEKHVGDENMCRAGGYYSKGGNSVEIKDKAV